MSPNVPVVYDAASPHIKQCVALRGLAVWVRLAWERAKRPT